MSTPTKPATTAMRRRQQTCSLSMTADRMVRMNGSTKKMAMASAIGMNFSARKNSVLLVAIRTPRSTFGQRRFGTRPPKPWNQTRKGRVKSVCSRKRAQLIWPGETVSEMYLAIASCPGRMIIARTQRPRPRRTAPWSRERAAAGSAAARRVIARVHGGKGLRWQWRRCSGRSGPVLAHHSRIFEEHGTGAPAFDSAQFGVELRLAAQASAECQDFWKRPHDRRKRGDRCRPHCQMGEERGGADASGKVRLPFRRIGAADVAQE